MGREAMDRRGSTYIVSGASGSGKTFITNELAKAFLCETPGPDGCCGKCRSCIYTANGTNPDLVRVAPEKNANVIPVDRIRESIVGDYETAPRFSPNKVYIIDGDHLNKEGQNALLKSIEEPPSDVIFIFETTNTDALLPTILSRAVDYKIKPYTKEEVVEIVRKLSPDISGDELDLLADFADGIPGRAVRLMSDETFLDLKNDLMDHVLSMPGEKVSRSIKRADEIFADYEHNYMEPAILLIWIVNDIMRLKADIDCEQVRFNQDRMRLEKFVVSHENIGIKEMGRILEYINGFLSDLKVNVKYEGCVTALTLKMYKELNK